jgi:hypothetical protein
MAESTPEYELYIAFATQIYDNSTGKPKTIKIKIPNAKPTLKTTDVQAVADLYLKYQPLTYFLTEIIGAELIATAITKLI